MIKITNRSFPARLGCNRIGVHAVTPGAFMGVRDEHGSVSLLFLGCCAALCCAPAPWVLQQTEESVPWCRIAVWTAWVRHCHWSWLVHICSSSDFTDCPCCAVSTGGGCFPIKLSDVSHWYCCAWFPQKGSIFKLVLCPALAAKQLA